MDKSYLITEGRKKKYFGKYLLFFLFIILISSFIGASSSMGSNAELTLSEDIMCDEKVLCSTDQFCFKNVCYDYECENDAVCNSDEVCWRHRCAKMFDIKILRVDSPITPGEFLDFTYFVKGMANIKGDVIIDFWLEEDGEKITSGSDTIYLGSFEEKTEITSIFLPNNREGGAFDFYIRVDYGKYVAQSHRVIQVGYGVPQVLDISLSDIGTLSSSDPFEFSAVFSFNRDQPLFLFLKESLFRDGKPVWSKESDLSVTRSRTLTKTIGKLEPGDYQLDVVGTYGENKSLKVSRVFIVKTSAKDFEIYAVSFLIALGVFVFFFILYWKMRKIKKTFIKDKKWIKRHKLSLSSFVLLVIFALLGYYFNYFGIIKFSNIFSVLIAYWYFFLIVFLILTGTYLIVKIHILKKIKSKIHYLISKKKNSIRNFRLKQKERKLKMIEVKKQKKELVEKKALVKKEKLLKLKVLAKKTAVSQHSKVSVKHKHKLWKFVLTTLVILIFVFVSYVLSSGLISLSAVVSFFMLLLDILIVYFYWILAIILGFIFLILGILFGRKKHLGKILKRKLYDWNSWERKFIRKYKAQRKEKLVKKKELAEKKALVKKEKLLKLKVLAKKTAVPQPFKVSVKHKHRLWKVVFATLVVFILVFVGYLFYIGLISLGAVVSFFIFSWDILLVYLYWILAIILGFIFLILGILFGRKKHVIENLKVLLHNWSKKFKARRSEKLAKKKLFVKQKILLKNEKLLKQNFPFHQLIKKLLRFRKFVFVLALILLFLISLVVFYYYLLDIGIFIDLDLSLVLVLLNNPIFIIAVLMTIVLLVILILLFTKLARFRVGKKQTNGYKLEKLVDKKMRKMEKKNGRTPNTQLKGFNLFHRSDLKQNLTKDSLKKKERDVTILKEIYGLLHSLVKEYSLGGNIKKQNDIHFKINELVMQLSLKNQKQVRLLIVKVLNTIKSDMSSKGDMSSS